MIYILVGSLDYAFYSLINIPLYSKDFSSLTSKGLPTNTDSLIYSNEEFIMEIEIESRDFLNLFYKKMGKNIQYMKCDSIIKLYF